MNKNETISRIESYLLRPPISLNALTAEDQMKFVRQRVAEMPGAITTEAGLLDRLRWSKRTGKPLKIKFGIDPTGPDIHLGHAVPLLNLRFFQLMGHDIQFVIGDFTGLIGDPSGRTDGRPALTPADIHANMKSYVAQASRIIDFSSSAVNVCYNSEWMGHLKVSDWVTILRRYSANELLQREDFRKRLTSGGGLTMAELEYALFMAYDSVVLKSDVELGGIDQFLNLHSCRTMMTISGQEPETIIVYDLLVGTTGEKDAAGRFVKMSKSRGNFVPVSTTPNELYGKTMSIADAVMWQWFRNLTIIRDDDLQLLKSEVDQGVTHPKLAKKLLARSVVATFNQYDLAAVATAEADFAAKFESSSYQEINDKRQLISAASLSLIHGLADVLGISRTRLRQLAIQNAIRVVEPQKHTLMESDLFRASSEFSGNLLRIGKLHFVEVK